MKPANMRTAALAHIASATIGPATRSRPLRLGLASLEPPLVQWAGRARVPSDPVAGAAGPAGPGPAG